MKRKKNWGLKYHLKGLREGGERHVKWEGK